MSAVNSMTPAVAPRPPRGRSLAALAVRISALLLIAASPFAPPLERPGQGRAVVYVVDRSLSVPGLHDALATTFVAEAQRLAQAEDPTGAEGTRIGLVTVASEAALTVPLGGAGLDAEEAASKPTSLGSDIAAGVRLALSALPQHGERRVVILSDGRQTTGDALAEVRAARELGVEVDVVPLGDAPRGGAVIANLEAISSHVAEGEPIEALATVRGEPGSQTTLRWSRDGVFQRVVYVPIDDHGVGESRFTDPDAATGVHTYAATLPEVPDAAGATTVAMVSGRPKVLVLTLAGERPALIVDALEQSGASVEVAALGDRAIDAGLLSGVDLVVLSDLPLERPGEVSLLSGLSGDAQEALNTFIREGGGGLIVTGGAFGFAPDYANTPLARMLPVAVESQGEMEDPSVAMAIMLDRSGSMGARVGTHSKMELAVEAALAAASTLRPDDRAAIAAIDVRTTWHQELAHTAELVENRERIRRIRAGGGGIYVYTALVDAYETLRTAPEPIRHVIVFSDTADSEEQFQGCPFMPCDTRLPAAVDLARSALGRGMTTSVVGIGRPRDADTTFLTELAAAGGGRFYLTQSGRDLRRIFVTETRAASRSNLREGSTPLSQHDSSALLEGIDLAALPPLSGFVQTERRSTADTALVSPDGHPILAHWRYGLGTVVALTSDAGGRWSDRWAESPTAGQLMRQLGRFTMRKRAATGADARLTLEGLEVELLIDLPEEATDVAPETVELHALAPGGTSKPVSATLERVGPGRYRARGRAGGEPIVFARVRDADGTLLAEAVGRQSDASEYALAGPDDRLLGELANAGGGVVSPSPADTLRPGAPIGSRPEPTWPFLLVLAAALVALDLWLRRLRRAVVTDVGGLPVRATAPEADCPA